MKLSSSLATSIVFTASLAGCVESDQPSESANAQSVLTNCTGFEPLNATDPIVPEKELLVRDLSVVEDPCRTNWATTGCSTSTHGKWTFGWLMTAMSGSTDINSPTARSFVANWLASWLTPQTVSPDPTPVAARPSIWGVMLKSWLVASGCAVPDDTVTDATIRKNALLNCTTLDLKAAPFRLLAIANRIDLDGRDYSGLSGAPGELRFAFGAFNRGTGAPVNAAVILEYQYPNTFPPSWWAMMFHNMSTQAFGSSFASSLQSNVTNLVVEPGAWPGKPNNGSAIGQVRTNENAFSNQPLSSRQWEFRQFALPCTSGSCNLAQVPVSQTPPLPVNNSTDLTNFMTANQTDLASSHHVVPTSMLGGSALSLPGANALVWNTTPTIDGTFTLVNSTDKPLSYNVRHNFAFATCNGCHYQETANQNQQFHIAPRFAGSVAAVSGFLDRTLNAGAVPADYLQVADPNPDSFDLDNGIPFYLFYNEIWRRSCEVRRVLANIQAPLTTATGH
jgi:hypothetical protein